MKTSNKFFIIATIFGIATLVLAVSSILLNPEALFHTKLEDLAAASGVPGVILGFVGFLYVLAENS